MDKNENLEYDFVSALDTIEDFPIKGISFKDISPVLQNPSLSKRIVESIRQEFDGKVDAVCGIESRGFLFGLPIALALNVPFIMIRKKGKLPPEVLIEEYQLEYGTDQIEMKVDSIQKNWRVLVHDDVLATGGTVKAVTNMLKKIGVKEIAYSFLITIKELDGLSKIKEANDIHIITKI